MGVLVPLEAKMPGAARIPNPEHRTPEHLSPEPSPAPIAVCYHPRSFFCAGLPMETAALAAQLADLSQRVSALRGFL